MVLRVELLGEVAAYVSGRPVVVGPARQRLVLAALAVDVDHVVSLGQLVDRVWGAEPPLRARGVLSSYVSRLRQVLGTGRLVRRSGGYVLVADPSQVDLHHFHDLCDQARGRRDDGRTVELLTEALALWRGDPLTGLDSEWVLAERDRLHQQRRLAERELTDARLRAGHGDDLVAELFGRVTELPLDERVAAQYMVALYRGGRAADALDHYRQFRLRLADELGTDPGGALQEVQHRILKGDLGLDRFTQYGSAAQLPEPQQPLSRKAPTATQWGLVPRQLPPDVANFAGREEYLAQLDDMSGSSRGAGASTVVISAIAGVGGVGKTALALHWAHRVSARHPDAQLYINLRGYAPDPPMTAGDVLPMFLRALGVAQAAIPLTEAEQTALYRSLLANRRALIVLDNAASAEQVRPLLPGGPACTVLVTSRDDLLGLTALNDARRLVLDVLPAEEAHALMALLLGVDRVAAEPDAVAALARLCGYLPLALRIAAAQLASDGKQTIAGYVAQLDAGDRLSRLAIGHDRDAAVRASFELSYRTLDAPHARLFRMLGCAPVPDWGVAAAAALIDASVEQAARILDRLAAAHLIETPRPGRYALHDLLRLYASERAQSEDNDEECDAARRRLFDMYLHTADTATTLAYPTSVPILTNVTGSGERSLPFTDFTRAKSWLDTERPNLVAAIRYAAENGPRKVTWRLAAALAPYFYGGMHRADWLQVSELGLRAAQKDGDRTAEATMMHVLHRVHFAFGDYDTALDYGLRGRDLFPLADNPGTEAEICKQFGHTYWLVGRLAESLDNFTRGRDLYRKIGNRVCELVCINGMALSYLDWGRLGDVLTHTNEVLVYHREVGARLCEAAALHIRALALVELGRFNEALDDGIKALAMYHETGFRYNEASVLSCIAGAYRDTGRHPEALEYGQKALTLAIEFNDTRGTSLAHTVLAGTHLILAQLDEASQHIDDAVRIADGTGYRRASVDAMIGLATITRARGDHENALDQARTALALARRCQFRACTARALTVLADIHRDRGDAETARELAEQALTIHSEVGYHLGDSHALRTFAPVEG